MRSRERRLAEWTSHAGHWLFGIPPSGGTRNRGTRFRPVAERLFSLEGPCSQVQVPWGHVGLVTRFYKKGTHILGGVLLCKEWRGSGPRRGHGPARQCIARRPRDRRGATLQRNRSGAAWSARRAHGGPGRAVRATNRAEACCARDGAGANRRAHASAWLLAAVARWRPEVGASVQVARPRRGSAEAWHPLGMGTQKS